MYRNGSPKVTQVLGYRLLQKITAVRIPYQGTISMVGNKGKVIPVIIGKIDKCRAIQGSGLGRFSPSGSYIRLPEQKFQ